MPFYCKLAVPQFMSMKKLLLFALLLSFSFAASAQKKNKGKNAPPTDYQVSDTTELPPPPASKKGKSKNSKPNPAATDYQQPEAVADTATRFTGVIKYRISTDDPADNDSMYIIFSDTRIRVTMFLPTSKPDVIYENTMIANIADSSLTIVDKTTRSYRVEKWDARNAGTELSLNYKKKNGQILKFFCREFSGEMKTPDGETFEAAALVSNQHSFINLEDYTFLNIQPVVLDYKIVLAWRTKTSANENTYIVAYKIEPGNTDAWFDLTGLTRK